MKTLILTVSLLIGPLTTLVASANTGGSPAASFNGRAFNLPDYLQVERDRTGFYRVVRGLDHKVGNGGDYLRGQFIAVGQQVLEYLRTLPSGQRLVRTHNINVESLAEALNTERIVVVDRTLIDNTRSVVDAIGVPGLILLNSEAWKELFESSSNIYYLVFHEMLRSAAVNDDNYEISEAIRNFPESLRINTQLASTLPMVNELQMRDLVGHPIASGSGCPVGTSQDVVLNEKLNAFDIKLSKFNLSLGSTESFNRLACALRVPVRIPPNKRVRVTMAELHGEILNGQPRSNMSARINLSADVNVARNQGDVVQNFSLSQGDRSFIVRKGGEMVMGCNGARETMLAVNAGGALLAGSNGSRGARLANKPESLIVKRLTLYVTLENCPRPQ